MPRFKITLDNGLRGVTATFANQPYVNAFYSWQKADGTYNYVPATMRLISDDPYTYRFFAQTNEALATTNVEVDLIVDSTEVPEVESYPVFFDPPTTAELLDFLNKSSRVNAGLVRPSNSTRTSDTNGVYITKRTANLAARDLSNRSIYKPDDVNSGVSGFNFRYSEGGMDITNTVSDTDGDIIIKAELEDDVLKYYGVDSAHLMGGVALGVANPTGFGLTDVVIDQTTGAQGEIDQIITNGGTDYLYLKDVTGTFGNGNNIDTDPATGVEAITDIPGAATAEFGFDVPHDPTVVTEDLELRADSALDPDGVYGYLFPTGGTVITVANATGFVVGSVLTGALSGATGTVVGIQTNGAATTDYLFLENVTGTFQDGENVDDGGGAEAITSIPDTSGLPIQIDLESGLAGGDTILGNTSDAIGYIAGIVRDRAGREVLLVVTVGSFQVGETINGGPDVITSIFAPVRYDETTAIIGQNPYVTLIMDIAKTRTAAVDTRLTGWRYWTEYVRTLIPDVLPSEGNPGCDCVIAEWDMQLASLTTTVEYTEEDNVLVDTNPVPEDYYCQFVNTDAANIIVGRGQVRGEEAADNRVYFNGTDYDPDGRSRIVIDTPTCQLDDLTTETDWAPGGPEEPDSVFFSENEDGTGTTVGSVDTPFPLVALGVDDTTDYTDAANNALSGVVTGVTDLAGYPEATGGRVRPSLLTGAPSTGGTSPVNADLKWSNGSTVFKYQSTRVAVEMMAADGTGTGDGAVPDPSDGGVPVLDAGLTALTAEGTVSIGDPTIALSDIAIGVGVKDSETEYATEEAARQDDTFGSDVASNILESTGGSIFVYDAAQGFYIPAGLGVVNMIEEDQSPTASDRHVYAAMGRYDADNTPAVAATGFGAGAVNYAYTDFTIRCRLMAIAIEV